MPPRAHGDVGATTEIATLVAYGLGALAGHGAVVPALAAALATVALLDTKAPLHGLLQRIHHDELRSAIKLLLVSAVLLPILPNEGYGPNGILNPYKLWWIVVLVAGLSLAGHFARRLAGPGAGPILTGLVGGLVDAITVTAATLAGAAVPVAVAAILIAAVNTLVKIGIAAALGSRGFALNAAGAVAAVLAAGGAGFIVAATI